MIHGQFAMDFKKYAPEGWTDHILKKIESANLIKSIKNFLALYRLPVNTALEPISMDDIDNIFLSETEWKLTSDGVLY